MKTIVFLGCRMYGTSREAVKAAKELGCCTVVVTDRRRLDLEEADELIFMEDLFEKEKLLLLIGGLEQKGRITAACVSFIDPFVSYAADISRELGLNCFTADALSLAENKAKVRNKLKNLDSAPFCSLYDHQPGIPEFAAGHEDSFPLILKPAVSNGSKDILLVHTAAEMKNALLVLRKRYGEGTFLAEEYLEGPQYLIEIAVYKGELFIIAVIEQEWNESFIITGYAYPAELTTAEQVSLCDSIQKIIEGIGLRQGSCHLEMRNVKGTWKLVEVNPRMSGGWMNEIIWTGTGINLLKEILKMHLGEKPDFNPAFRKNVYARCLTVNSVGKLLYIGGKERALKLEGVESVHLRLEKGRIVTPPRSMGDRYACIITSADTIFEAKGIARSASRKLIFYLDPL
ncbi:ATP-grasp domain-containing protein [Lysinibacillus sphaericus]